jgi:hypothetical protein
MAGVVEMICPTGEAKYFCEWGWTANSLICPSGNSIESLQQITGIQGAIFSYVGHSGASPTGPRKARPDDRLRDEPGIQGFPDVQLHI